MKQEFIRDGIKLTVDLTELQEAIECANLLTDKIKEAIALSKELASLSDCLDFKMSISGKPEDDEF